VQYDPAIPEDVQERLTYLIKEGSPNPVQMLAPNASLTYSQLPAGTIILSFGNVSQANLYISTDELVALGPEGFIVRSATPATSVLVLVTNGNPLTNLQPFKTWNNIGLHFGAYQLLKELGYGFLHPLEQLIPSPFRLPSSPVDVTEMPRWGVRGWHYHTEHPLELTEFLNGMDSGNTPWASMQGEFAQFAEWLGANRQNRIEFILLWTREWDEFAWSTTRQERLTKIVDILHAFGVAAGADVPLAEQQQHAWYFTGPRYTTEQQFANISKHIDWILVADFDFIATESGFSEFTHPNCTLMLSWMNFAVDHVMTNYEGKRVYIKCHCSTGQVCPEYVNPESGEPINFNFLPAYATPDLGIYPHTVQIYTLTEPAPTYGNQNFTYMLEFLVQETGRREVIYHPETAYWVNYDIDLPLFLPPVYGANRLTDLRIIDEATGAVQRDMQGQINFGSGWEWAYWLGDMLCVEASWDPLMTMSDEEALQYSLQEGLRSFGPSSAVDGLVTVLMDFITTETNLLIYGNWNGTEPSNVVRRNGQAYLQGWDTWSEWSALVAPGDATQPAKLTFQEVRSPIHPLGKKEDLPDYVSEIQPLLNAMQLNFTALTNQLADLRPQMYPEALPFFDEIVDSANITALRAQEVYLLYEYVWGTLHHTPSWRSQRIEEANKVLVQVEEVIRRRESHYRVPVDRIAGWRKNPTAYNYGYLWTVHSAYYFWRDYSQATNTSLTVRSPCFMNIITPVDIAFGPGKVLNASLEVGYDLEQRGLTSLSNCTHHPLQEPVYPATPIVDPSSTFVEVPSMQEMDFEEFWKSHWDVLVEALTPHKDKK